MPSLVDITPLREIVDIRGVKVTVRGMGITVIGQCLADSEDLQKFWAARKFDAGSLLASLPRTVSRIVATSIVEDTKPATPITDVINGFAPAGDDEDTYPGGDYWQPPPDLTARLAKAAAAATDERERQIMMNMIAFEELNSNDQLTLVEAVIRVSFPGGISPFVDRLGTLGGRPNLTASWRARFGKAPDTSSPPPSSS